MKITRTMLKIYAEEVNSPARKSRRILYRDMYLAFNGGLYPLILEAISKEFKDPQAVSELKARLVPINILQKVIKKLAGVYIESPMRSPVEESDDDAELLEDYEDITRFNIRQKQANRYLELFKKNLKEIFTDPATKRPMIRNLAPHTYEVFNVKSANKAQADMVCKIVRDSMNVSEQELHWYSDESFFITDGAGIVLSKEMAALENGDGKNPAKSLPFVYKTKSTDGVDPVVDDSLFRISVAIPIVLTDLFFACKYQCWSIIYTIGVKGEINRNPSSVIALDFSEGAQNTGQQPVIDAITPTVDSDKVIKMIEATLNMYLSSVGLSGGTLSTGQSASDVVSGVSKMLDSAEAIEGKKDQQDDMLEDEDMTWEKIKVMIPYWRRNGMVADPLNTEFSKAFRVSVTFQEPKAMISEKDRITTIKDKLAAKLTSWRRALIEMNPDYTTDQIDELMEEITEDMAKNPQVYGMQSPPVVAPPPVEEEEEDGLQS